VAYDWSVAAQKRGEAFTGIEIDLPFLSRRTLNLSSEPGRERGTTCLVKINDSEVTLLMDPLTVSGTCVGLLAGISALSKELTTFVNRTREARKDVDGFSRELASIGLCVSSLKDEDFEFPARLQEQLACVLGNCDRTVQDMDKIVRKHSTGGLGQRLRWSLSDGQDVSRLRERLEAHKATLEITLDLGQLALVSSIREDTRDIRAELRNLRLQIDSLVGLGARENPMLQRFLEESVMYAESVLDDSQVNGERLPEDAADSLTPEDIRVDPDAYTAETHVPQQNQTDTASAALASDPDVIIPDASAPSTLALLQSADNTRSPALSSHSLRHLILSRLDYRFEGGHCEFRKHGRGIVVNSAGTITSYCSFSSEHIDIFKSQWDIGVEYWLAHRRSEEIAWAIETSRGILFSWWDIEKFAYEDGGPKGYLRDFWCLWYTNPQPYSCQDGFLPNSRHFEVLYPKSPGGYELYSHVQKAYLDAKGIGPIITNHDSFKKNVRMLKQDRSERTVANLLPGTFSALAAGE
jgi:hypothetical protein